MKNTSKQKWTAHHFPKGTVFEYTYPEIGVTHTATVCSVNSKRSMMRGVIQADSYNEELKINVCVMMEFVTRIIKRGDGPVVYGNFSDGPAEKKFFDTWLCEDGKIRKSHSLSSLRCLLTRTIRKINPMWEHELNNEGINTGHFLTQLKNQSWCKPLEPSINDFIRFTINQKKFDRFVRQNWRRWLAKGNVSMFKASLLDPDTKTCVPRNRDFHDDGLDALTAGYSNMYNGIIKHANCMAMIKETFRPQPCISQPLLGDKLPHDMADAIPKPVVHEDISITEWARANNPISSEKLHDVLTKLPDDKVRYVIVGGGNDFTNEDGTECISKPIVKRLSDL